MWAGCSGRDKLGIHSQDIASVDLQGLLEILSSASEFDDLPIRPGEEEAIRKLLMHAAVALDKPRYTDPHTKANALLQVCQLLPTHHPMQADVSCLQDWIVSPGLHVAKIPRLVVLP